ncbi:fibronectin type III domain-containing protein [Brevundimonas sp. AJA228-03]|nr:fibronectin type III domain-containing protein [Brevundimonas sp. AJA228-03]
MKLLAALMATFLWTGTALADAPSMARTWHWNVGSTSAGLSMAANDAGLPGHFWFELGTSPDLSDAHTVGDERNDQGYGGVVQSHATMSDLRPGTTYYYRAHVRNYDGQAQSGIQSFTTAAASAIAAPSISFEKSQPYEGGWMFDFVVDGHGLGGEVRVSFSTSPDMSNAREILVDRIEAGPTGQGIHAIVPPVTYPDRTTIYVRAVATSSAGTSSANAQMVYRNADY